ncbi:MULTISPECIES: hypothetical protein [unclassified Streptomyces]|uniref:hypothetical protein n=1 Tax=unclassified Streptomyces TaxID=2593676 RepID=UPI003325B24F
MKELVDCDDRSVAPSTQVDVATVLAHALHARKGECLAGCCITLLWALFLVVDVWGGTFHGMTEWSLAKAYDLYITKEGFRIPDLVSFFLGSSSLPIGKTEPSTGTWVANYAIVSSLQWLVRALSGHGTGMYSAQDLKPRGKGGLVREVLAPGMLLLSYWATALVAVWNNSANWVAVVFPLLLSVPVWVHRRAVEAVMRDRFSEEEFKRNPEQGITGPKWLRDLGETIRQEQHSEIVLYDPDQPFAGSGQAMETWSVVMDLEPKPGAGPLTLTSAEVLEGVRQRLMDLARPPISAVSRDRLLNVKIDEVVYLPAGPPRNEVDHAVLLAAHRAASIGEGGEARRHFLRAQIVMRSQSMVSVLIRVQVQGEVLALEVVPHTLDPLHSKFDLVDDIVERHPSYPVSSLGRAFLATPAAGVAAILAVTGLAVRSTLGAKRRLERRRAEAFPPSKGAARSVREIAPGQRPSTLQAMDSSRYLRTLQECVSTGVIRTLKEKGFQTGSLEQQVIQVSNGGVYITAMNGGAVATGRGSRARGADNRPVRTLQQRASKAFTR